MNDEGFTQKEMLIRIMDKLDTMECKMNETHELAIKTNGKVKLHTKAIFSLAGALITTAGWFVYHLINSIPNI